MISVPRSSPAGSASTRTTLPWSSRPASTCGWTATSGSSRTTGTGSSTRPRQQEDLTELIEPAGDEPFILHPGEFVLGSTYETVTLPDDLAGRLEGKSSLGRLGLLTHSTAGFIDPGFTGHVTLELSNVATLPIKLWPGMKIGQLCLLRMTSAGRAPVRVRARPARATRASAARRRRAPT